MIIKRSVELCLNLTNYGIKKPPKRRGECRQEHHHVRYN